MCDLQRRDHCGQRSNLRHPTALTRIRTWMAYAGVVVAALLFQRVGAAESLGLLVLYLTAGVERRPLRQALTAALLTMLFLWLVFFRLLQLRLPGLIFK